MGKLKRVITFCLRRFRAYHVLSIDRGLPGEEWRYTLSRVYRDGEILILRSDFCSPGTTITIPRGTRIYYES